MKIGEYEQMMSYLTRRENFRGGTNPKTGQGFQKGNILGVKENITERNKKLVEEKNKKVLRTKELIKAGDTPAEAKKKVIKEFNLDRDPKAGTPRWLKQAKEELTNEGFKFTASKPGPENVGGKEKATKKREQVIGEGKTFESRLKKEKTKTGFGKKFETAHTANIFQAKKLGIDYPVDALAIQATNVNQEVAEILNDELKPLYKKQLNLVNKLKKNNTFALRKELDDINFKISETVATGGKQGNKAANVLKPIIVDPQNLKGKILDLGFKTSDEVLTLPGATTKGTKAGTIDDLMARMNIKENVLQKAKDLKKPDKAKTRDMFKDFEIRTNQLGSNLGLLRGVGETLKAIPTPTGTLALTAGFGVDPTSTIDRVALEAEAALAPELVKQTSRLTSNPIVQRFFNLGLSPANAMRVARAAQPLGVASLIGEGLYELSKRGVAEKAKLDAMTPFQKQQYLAGEIEPLMDEGGMVDISREGFSVGGLASLFKKAAQVSDALRKVKNATFDMFNNVRMFGDQKGIEKNLEGFTNIPDKNRKISSLEDIQTLKANVPEKYHQDLDIMMKSIEQNNFETAFKQYEKFEKNLDPSLKFENIPEEYFPMVDPLNDAFVIKKPRDNFKIGRYKIRTSMNLDETGKPTGKYQTEKYDTFDPETGKFREEPELVGLNTDKGKEGLN